MAQTVKCDHCGHGTEVKLKRKAHPHKVIEHYFKCGTCKNKYVAYVTDPYVRELQRKVRVEKDSNQKLFLQVQMKDRMDQLKAGLKQ